MSGQSTPQESDELLAYMRERDALRERRRGWWIVASVVAVVVALAGWGVRSYLGSARETDEFNERRVECFVERGTGDDALRYCMSQS